MRDDGDAARRALGVVAQDLDGAGRALQLQALG